MRVEKGEFENLSVFMQGYAAYMLGPLEEEPYVPNITKNPFPENTLEYDRWEAGQALAAVHSHDEVDIEVDHVSI